MRQKYEKPYARNLGEMLPNAEGYCVAVGTSANLPLPKANCLPGLTALGAVCGFGGFVNPVACQTGGTPVCFGCIPGTYAAAPCNAGDGVL